MIRRFELIGDLGIAPGEVDAQLRQKLLLEHRTLRPAISAMVTVTSVTISDAIGRRPLPNRQLIRTYESRSSTRVRKEDLSIFFRRYSRRAAVQLLF